MKKWLPVLMCSLLVLTACGTKESDNASKADEDNNPVVNTSDSKQLALGKISHYAKSNGNSAAPSITDYKNAGVTSVTASNIKQINKRISQLEETDVDTLPEINGVIVDLDIATSPASSDFDNDGIKDSLDNCPSHANPDQKDGDGDGSGDVCDLDSDQDGHRDNVDNCPAISNPNQRDSDGDGEGDACDSIDSKDDDKDGISNELDNCPSKSNPKQSDVDKNGIGDVCDTTDMTDDDKDTIINILDNCPAIANTDQKDKDKDGKGDVCDKVDDRDEDKDGIINVNDNCPLHANKDQSDVDGDGVGDLCDKDDPLGDLDKDGIKNGVDNCPVTSNKNQLNTDGDKKGDACDADDDNDGVDDGKDDYPLDKNKASSVENALRLLSQTTFGATESEIDKVVKMGAEAWLDNEIAKHSAYVSESDGHKSHLQRTEEITQLVEPSVSWTNNGIFNTAPAALWQVRHYQMSAWWENALGHPNNTMHGSDQLRQRIAYALSQLLVVSAKDPRLYLRGDSIAYYNDILAENAFGNYRTLLGKISRSATMGVYLTYQGNKKANPEKSTRPDENFARELIQLFTIGLYELNIDGSPNRDGNVNSYPDAGSKRVPTYTQKDVVELAKVMTGWDAKGTRHFGDVNMGVAEYAAQMEFKPEYHEDEVAEGGDGQVTVLGKTFALNSGADGSGLDTALDVIFGHPNLAPFVSKNLIMNLVTSNPSSAYVARITKVFDNNGKGVKGDLKAVIKAILMDAEARSPASQPKNFGKVKEPFLVFTQLLRSFNVKPVDGWRGPKNDTRGDGSSSTVNGVYMFTSPENYFGQAPLRSKSVFNFYMPDYVPSDNYFASNRLVAPETQIQTDGNIINSHNYVAKFLRYDEKNFITKTQGKTLAENGASKQMYHTLMMLDFDRELKLFEKALEGDSNADFSKIKSDSDREKGVTALLKHLDKIMLGNTMSSAYKASLQDYLVNQSNFRGETNHALALHLISDAVKFIATSSAYMVLK